MNEIVDAIKDFLDRTGLDALWQRIHGVFTTKTSFNDHTGNTIVHITGEERTRWNSQTSANNGHVTIKKNGVDVATFGLNDATDTTADLTDVASAATLESHITDLENPHMVTAEQAGAISVDNLDTYSQSGSMPVNPQDDHVMSTKAVDEFVNSKIAGMSAQYITYNTSGDPFPSVADLLNATTYYYNGQPTTLGKNDYAIVLVDEQHSDATTRWLRVGEGEQGTWQFQYKISDTPFTEEQWAAINSGINATRVAQYDAYANTKVNVMSTTDEMWHAYTHTNSGSAQVDGDIPISNTLNGDTIVQRKNDANIEVPLEPSTDSDATSKKYVDSNTANKWNVDGSNANEPGAQTIVSKIGTSIGKLNEGDVILTCYDNESPTQGGVVAEHTKWRTVGTLWEWIKSKLGILSSTGSTTKWLNQQGGWTTPTPNDIGAATNSHVHGYITNSGAIKEQAYIENMDNIIISDSSDYDRLKRAILYFDASTTDKYLTPKGTWEYATIQTVNIPTIEGSPSSNLNYYCYGDRAQYYIHDLKPHFYYCGWDENLTIAYRPDTGEKGEFYLECYTTRDAVAGSVFRTIQRYYRTNSSTGRAIWERVCTQNNDGTHSYSNWKRVAYQGDGGTIGSVDNPVYLNEGTLTPSWINTFQYKYKNYSSTVDWLNKYLLIAQSGAFNGTYKRKRLKFAIHDNYNHVQATIDFQVYNANNYSTIDDINDYLVIDTASSQFGIENWYINYTTEKKVGLFFKIPSTLRYQFDLRITCLSSYHNDISIVTDSESQGPFDDITNSRVCNIVFSAAQVGQSRYQRISQNQGIKTEIVGSTTNPTGNNNSFKAILNSASYAKRVHSYLNTYVTNYNGQELSDIALYADSDGVQGICNYFGNLSNPMALGVPTNGDRITSYGNELAYRNENKYRYHATDDTDGYVKICRISTGSGNSNGCNFGLWIETGYTGRQHNVIYLALGTRITITSGTYYDSIRASAVSLIPRLNETTDYGLPKIYTKLVQSSSSTSGSIYDVYIDKLYWSAINISNIAYTYTQETEITFPMSFTTSLPSSTETVTFGYLLRGETQDVGNSSTPVYFDSDGIAKTCGVVESAYLTRGFVLGRTNSSMDITASNTDIPWDTNSINYTYIIKANGSGYLTFLPNTDSKTQIKFFSIKFNNANCVYTTIRYKDYFKNGSYSYIDLSRYARIICEYESDIYLNFRAHSREGWVIIEYTGFNE